MSDIDIKNIENELNNFNNDIYKEFLEINDIFNTEEEIFSTFNTLNKANINDENTINKINEIIFLKYFKKNEEADTSLLNIKKIINYHIKNNFNKLNLIDNTFMNLNNKIIKREKDCIYILENIKNNNFFKHKNLNKTILNYLNIKDILIFKESLNDKEKNELTKNIKINQKNIYFNLITEIDNDINIFLNEDLNKKINNDISILKKYIELKKSNINISLIKIKEIEKEMKKLNFLDKIIIIDFNNLKEKIYKNLNRNSINIENEKYHQSMLSPVFNKIDKNK